MTLERALDILATIHLRDDDLAGFVVQMGAGPCWGNHISQEEYIAAWGVVRDYLHPSLPVYADKA